MTESTLSIDPAQTPVVAQLLAELIPQLQVKVPKHKKKTPPNKALNKAAVDQNNTTTPMNTQTTSPFCNRYSDSCVRECTRVQSKPKTTTCQKTQDGQDDDTYDLLCACENDKLETQHALAGIAADPDDDDQEVLTTTQSSNGTTSIATQTKKKSASVIGTSTSTTTVQATKTKSQGTATITSTSVVNVTTTTVVAIAPTGRIRVDDNAGKVSRT